MCLCIRLHCGCGCASVCWCGKWKRSKKLCVNISFIALSPYSCANVMWHNLKCVRFVIFLEEHEIWCTHKLKCSPFQDKCFFFFSLCCQISWATQVGRSRIWELKFSVSSTTSKNVVSQLDHDSIKYRLFANISFVIIVPTLQRLTHESGRERERRQEYSSCALRMNVARPKTKRVCLTRDPYPYTWRDRASQRQNLRHISTANATMFERRLINNIKHCRRQRDDYGNNGIESLPYFLVRIHSYLSMSLAKYMWRRVAAKTKREREEKKKPSEWSYRQMAISERRRSEIYPQNQ